MVWPALGLFIGCMLLTFGFVWKGLRDFYDEKEESP